MKIRHKIQLFVLTGTIIVFVAAFSFIAFQNKNTILKESKEIVHNKAKEAANFVVSKLDNDMGACRALADAFHHHRSFGADKRDDILDMEEYVLKNNPKYINVWSSWQLSEFDTAWGQNPGRVSMTCYRMDGKIYKKKSLSDIGGIKNRSTYHEMMDAKEEQIWVPYFDTFIFTLEDQVLETTMAVPVLRNNIFEGMVGIDVELRNIQEFIKKIQPYKNSFAILLAQDGSFVSHPSDSLLGKMFADHYPEDTKKHNILKKIHNGQAFGFISDHFIKNKEALVSFAPITIGRTDTPWSLGVIVPMDVIQQKANAGIYTSLVVGIIGLLLLILVTWYISIQISNPIIKTTESLNEIISTGDVDESKKVKVNTKDELGTMAIAINKLMDNLRITANFAKNIGKGNYNIDYKPLSDKDVLGNSLINMRESFKKADIEDEKRKEEDRKRNWTQEGLAKFGDILRLNNDNLDELAYQVIMNLVKYIDANQGGIFILNGEDDDKEKYLELKGCFAYDRKKHLEKKIKLGEGLVGACFLEKKSTYLKEVPGDYISISSGLGEAPPNHILISPLMFNEKVFGVVEIASFEAFEDHVIEFVEKVGENIASTIASVKINLRTAKLLEQSQNQSEQLKSQEEEMRQNMEELQATQEEMTRKNVENESVMNGINSTLAIIEYDMQGKVIDVNEQFLKIVELAPEEVKTMTHKDFIDQKLIDDGTYNEIWNKLRKGNAHSDIFEHDLRKGKIWTQETLTPISDSSGNPYKVMTFIVDISEQKKLELKTHEQLDKSQAQEEELRENMEKLHETQVKMKEQETEMKGVLDALNSSTNMVEYDLDGFIIFVNDAYLNLLDLKREEVIGKHHKYKIELSEKEEKEYENFWKELIRGKTKKEINNFIVNGKNIWLLETYTPIRDEKGKVYKILKIALDITESKELEQQLQQHTEELKSQEEELRQNLEEVSTIQEEVTKKDKEFEKLSKELEIKNVKLKSIQEKLTEVQKFHKAKEQKMQEEINKLKNK